MVACVGGGCRKSEHRIEDKKGYNLLCLLVQHSSMSMTSFSTYQKAAWMVWNLAGVMVVPMDASRVVRLAVVSGGAMVVPKVLMTAGCGEGVLIVENESVCC